ncbi:MAG: alpha/beta hydrolase [Gammaproteobacteria bacterium]
MKTLIKLIGASLIALATCSYVVADEHATQTSATLTLTERIIPPPVGVSQEMLEIIKSRAIPPAMPVPGSTEAWLELQAAFDAPGEAQGRFAAERNKVSFEVKEIAGVRTYFVTPEKLNDRWKDHVFVHTHGGAFVFGGGDSVLREAVWIANGLGVKVASVDYRRPPLHPFPAAVDDAVAVWLDVIKDQDPAGTVLFGTSAGGNIALATTLRLKQLGKPLPGAIFAGTPATDLEGTSDTWYTLEGLDPLGQRDGVIAGTFTIYAADADRSDPLLSPVNGDLAGFPPTILISGTRDLLLSDTVRMHRALRSAAVTADLHIYDGQSHGDYLNGIITDLPESDDAIRELNKFFDTHLKK